jgi:DNA polymerase-3 subunit gamma/tau
VWDEILGYVGRKRRAAAAVAREATVREVRGDTLVLLFKHLVHANMLSNAPDLLLEGIQEVLGPPSPNARWQIRCEVAGQGAPGPAAPVAPARVPPAPRTGTVRDDGGWPATATPGGPTAPTPPPAPASPPPPAPVAQEQGSGDEYDPDSDAVVDEPTARQTSEQAALHLLAQALGAEKIGELDNR